MPHVLSETGAPKRRIMVPVTKSFREIAKAERRSLSQQAQIAIEAFENQWRAKIKENGAADDA